jgi:hypothetical protein
VANKRLANLKGFGKMLPMLPQLLALTWSMVTVQIVGLISAWAVRRSEGSRHQSICCTIFYFCLVLVALTAMASFSVGPGGTLACSATLSIMVVASIGEFRRPAQASYQ